MSRSTSNSGNRERGKFAIDIGSTVIKLATIGNDGDLLDQEFHERNYESEISDQVAEILSPHRIDANRDEVVICSSANGGLRVGVVCLTASYSGWAYRNQVLLGGANPVYVQEISATEPTTQYVDILIVGGGIDCADVDEMRLLVENFSPSNYNFGALVYAGNKFLAKEFVEHFPDAKVVHNPMANGLSHPKDTIFVALRDAYLEDLVYKQGITEVAKNYGCVIRPTPEVVNSGYYRAMNEGLFPDISGASVLMDIGGATTDFHYTVELVRDDSENRPPDGLSIARYVFTDLGVYASVDSTVLQLRRNPRTFEFLDVVLGSDVSDTYRQLREGEYSPPADILGYACIFLGLDRFSRGDGPGLPTAELSKLNKIILTGGAAQLLDENKVADLVGLFLTSSIDSRFITIDRKYEIWVYGSARN